MAVRGAPRNPVISNTLGVRGPAREDPFFLSWDILLSAESAGTRFHQRVLIEGMGQR